MAKSSAFVGFPEGMLGDKPVRLPVLANNAKCFVLNKFAGLSGQTHPWYSRPDVTSSLRLQAKAGKGELKRLGIEKIYYICGPEVEVSGPVLFAKTKDAAMLFNNALGSNLIRFTFNLFTPEKLGDTEISCELPIATHKSEARSLISHKSGKKSFTQFRRIGQSPSLDLWEAETSLPRMHQVRLHAAELGLAALGDQLYGRELLDSMPNSKRTWKRNIPRFSGLGVAQTRLDLSKVVAEPGIILGEISKPFISLLRKCGFEGAQVQK